MTADLVQRFRASRNWWIDHPMVDWIVVGILVAAGVATDVGLSERAAGSPRHVWYQTLAAVLAGMLGIAITATTILWALVRGPRLRRLILAAGPRLTHLYMTSLASLASCAVIAAVAIPVDAGQTANAFANVVDAAFIISTLRGARLLWMFGRMLTVISEDARETSEPDRWESPTITDADYPLQRRS